MRKLQVGVMVVLGLVSAQASAHEVERRVEVGTARAPEGRSFHEERRDDRQDRREVRGEVRRDVRRDVRREVEVRPGSYTRTTYARVIPVMDEWSFRGLMFRIGAPVAPGVRLAMVSDAVQGRSFTSAQVIRLLGGLYGDERLEALRIVSPRIVDRGSCGLLLASFRGHDRREAAYILGI